MSIDDQAAQGTERQAIRIRNDTDPVTLTEDAKVKDALSLMQINKIGGIPVINSQGKLVGILQIETLFETDGDRPVAEIMTKDKLVTAPKEQDYYSEGNIAKYKIEKLPVIDDHHLLVGLITYKDIMKLENFPYASKDLHGRLLVGAAVGVTADTFDRINALVHMGVDVICVDTAHGHSKGVLDMIGEIRKSFLILANCWGNVATAEGAVVLKMQV